jgi:SPP1 family predicted phage head-tail adaptor
MTLPTPGELDQELVLEEQQRSPIAGGGAVLTWVAVATLWGAVRPRSGIDTVVSDQRIGRQTAEVWIRYRPGVTPFMRFRLGTRLLGIVAVLELGGRHRWLKCLVEEEPA